MLKLYRTVWMLACGCALLAGLAAASETSTTEELKLRRVAATDALTLLRSIAGAKQIEVVDAQTIRVTDTPEKLVLARKIVDLIEQEDPAKKDEIVAAATYDAGDGTTVARFVLRHATTQDVMTALRSQLRIQRLAVVEKLSTVLIRDSAAQVKAAQELVRSLESGTP